jgi:2-iminobutanoate/2-iminopropanoate deaminase
MRTVVQAKSWPSPRFRYSPLIAAGPFLKTAGMIALDSSTGQLEKCGPGAEARKFFPRLVR